MKTTAHLIKDSLQGKRFGTMDFSRFHEAIGEPIVGITPDRIGKFKLQQVLRRKFGINYKNHPIGVEALKHFETSARVMKGINNGS